MPKVTFPPRKAVSPEECSHPDQLEVPFVVVPIFRTVHPVIFLCPDCGGFLVPIGRYRFRFYLTTPELVEAAGKHLELVIDGGDK